VQERWAESIREEMQPLSFLVLYRTTECWRFAVYAGGVMDGRLQQVPVEASEQVAQRALFDLVEGGYGRPIRAEWRRTDPDWWTAKAWFAD
jgi:hypothetical protein